MPIKRFRGQDGLSWVDGTIKPDASDSYQATWKFMPGDTATYAEVTGEVTIKVHKAAPTGEPEYTRITTGGKTLADANLTITGSTLKPNAGILEWVDDDGKTLSDDTVVEANRLYKWRFTPENTNYNVLTGEIELYHVTYDFIIRASAGEGGSISPSGSVSVREGGDQTFIITPDRGYAVSDVKVDEKSVGKVQAYTFENVAGSHTIEAVFVKISAFVDVPAGSYYYDAVLWAAENGITKGTSETTFSPGLNCSRAQIVTFLWRSEKSPAAGSRNPFTDVAADAYYTGAVLWAVDADITKGASETAFSPNADCTRAQIVTFLWRCKK